MFLTRLLVLAGVVLCSASGAFAQLRVVDYNLAKLIGDIPSARGVLTAIGQDDKFGFATAPAVMCFQEIPNTVLASVDALVLSAFPGVPYARGTYTTSGTEDGAGGAQAMYYRTDLLTEIVSGHADIATGASRNSDRWLLQLNGYTSTSARFYIYASHLKASNTPVDAATRNTGAIALRANADALGAGVHAIFCGDYNLYTNTEATYATMTAAGNAQCVDPLGTANWTGAANAIKHTQSPRLLSGALVGGGVDDRFDFQFSSIDFHDGDGLSMIAGTYRTFGNDGNHYNLDINTGNNDYFPADIPRSNAAADMLWAATDHMPVVADYQVPPIMNATMQATFGPVIVGATVTVPVLVWNSANVVHVSGSDALLASVVGSAGLVGSQQVTAPLAPSSIAVNLLVNTTAAASINASATISTAVEGAQNPTITRTLTGSVLAHARASWSAASVVASTTAPISTAANVGAVQIIVPMYNFGYTAAQSTLDIDGATGLVAPFSVVDSVDSGIGAAASSLVFSFDSNGRAPGVYSQVATIATSDANLPGATSASRTLTLQVTVTGGGNAADLNQDGSVNATDLAILLNAWGPVNPKTSSADIDGDGHVGGSDLAILLNGWS